MGWRSFDCSHSSIIDSVTAYLVKNEISSTDTHASLSSGKTDAQLAEADGSWVDVCDLANVHVRALEKEEVGD